MDTHKKPPVTPTSRTCKHLSCMNCSVPAQRHGVMRISVSSPAMWQIRQNGMITEAESESDDLLSRILGSTSEHDSLAVMSCKCSGNAYSDALPCAAVPPAAAVGYSRLSLTIAAEYCCCCGGAHELASCVLEPDGCASMVWYIGGSESQSSGDTGKLSVSIFTITRGSISSADLIAPHSKQSQVESCLAGSNASVLDVSCTPLKNFF